MPVFQYRVARSDGTTLEGQIEGNSEGAARSQLEGQGLLVFQLRRQGSWSTLASASTQRHGKIALQEFLIFNQELVALIKAGLPILKVWDLLIERAKHAGFRAVLESVRQDIRGGASASEALSRHPVHFPELYIASVKAGEQSGNLPEVLQRYIQHLKLMIGLRQKIVKALAYPSFLVVASAIVLAFFLLFVIPTFMEIYADSSKSLPFATQVLMSAVSMFQGLLLPGIIGLIIGGVAFRVWYRTAGGRLLWDGVFLNIPWIGDMLQKQYTIQFTRTLATVVSGGTPLVEALQIARGAISNRRLSTGLAAAVTEIREGAALAAALGRHRILPRVALEMVAVGEETGSLELMLRDVAEFYEGEMDFRLGQLATWIETALLLTMGVVVGTIVIIMYLPVFQMAGAP